MELFESMLRKVQELDPVRLIAPAVEVLLIGLGLYALLKFMQGTRGAGILRGMILFFLVAFLALFIGQQFYGVEKITWVLENLLALSVIGAVVIFQPEIRRGLVRLGQNPLVNLFVQPRSPLVDEIVEACSNLGRGRTGALIAIQRRVGLRSYVEGGTRLDAEISSELLQTIFHKDTRLHDGAIIIQGNRVAAAGCLLPLTENPEISKDLGTRHRAGIGVTEESDAVVVIVSEETGRISLAVNGELTRGLSAEDLGAVLQDLTARHGFVGVEGVDE